MACIWGRNLKNAPSAIHVFHTSFIKLMEMLKNYFRIAIRSFFRNKLHSFINIAGLTLGFAACFLIGLFIRDEYQFDKSMPDGARVYRICNYYTNSEGSSNFAV